MLVDWFTVCAQIANFLVLVWLLRRFLYAPVLAAIDARDVQVKAQIDDAQALDAKARDERAELERQRAEFDQQRAALLAQAESDAAAERAKLLDSARQDATLQRKRLLDAVAQEGQVLRGEITERTQAQVFAVARKALEDIADEDLDHQIARRFIKELGAVDTGGREKIRAALGRDGSPLVIRSRFPLSTADEAALRAAMRRMFGAGTDVRFDAADALVGGIELRANGYSVAWNLDEYLRGLETAAQLAPSQVAVSALHKPRPGRQGADK